MTEHTRDEFFVEAAKLGFPGKWAVDILRRNGVKGNFDCSQYDKYMKILQDYAAGLKRLIAVANKQEDKSHPFEKCPICGAPVERDSKLDRMYGCQLGWKCLNPEQGKPSHFFQYQLERIRPWMQRNQGMSDLEVSLKMNHMTESPSGVSLAVSSSVDCSG